MAANPHPAADAARTPGIDWLEVVRHVAVSRALDDLEESTLLPARKVLYQFSARGHDVTQTLLGARLTGRRDGVGGYYRSRPLLLRLGLTLDDALASTMMRVGGMSEGRDIGVVFNLPNKNGPCVLPVCGGVGAQYTPAVGWAQSLRYRQEVLKDEACRGSIAVAHGGDASTATNGFWAALNVVTTQKLPYLFFIEDNGYGISVPTPMQTPGGNIADNLSAFKGLRVLDGDGAHPMKAAALIEDAVEGVRSGGGPALIRLTVPRLSGHSGQDTQTYKGAHVIAAEQQRDPWLRLHDQLVPDLISQAQWDAEVVEAGVAVGRALERVEGRAQPDPTRVQRYLFTERTAGGDMEVQAQGGLLAEGISGDAGIEEAKPQGPRINLVTAVRRTLEHELAVNPRVLVFGEDVGRKGGVHAVTMGLQDQFRRVPRVRHQSIGGGHHRAGRGHGGRRTHARARNPVSQVCRSGGGTTQRLRHHALAHGESIRGAHGRTHSRWVLQVRRSLA